MNDADWFKKIRRGPRGGCALLLGFAALAALAALA